MSECPKCGGRGHVLVDGVWHRCACLQRKVDKQKLGVFDTEQVERNTPLLGLVNQNTLIDGPLGVVRSHVAGALLHLSEQGKTYGAMDAYRLVEIFLDKVEEYKSTQDLAEFDLFIMLMGFGDIANRRLPEIILQALNRRELVQKPTWIVLGIPLNSVAGRYDAAVYERIAQFRKARVE